MLNIPTTCALVWPSSNCRFELMPPLRTLEYRLLKGMHYLLQLILEV